MRSSRRRWLAGLAAASLQVMRRFTAATHGRITAAFKHPNVAAFSNRRTATRRWRRRWRPARRAALAAASLMC